MEASLAPQPTIATARPLCRARRVQLPKPGAELILRSSSRQSPGARKLNLPLRAVAMEGVTAAADPAQAEVTWQIVVGAVGQCSVTSRLELFDFAPD